MEHRCTVAEAQKQLSAWMNKASGPTLRVLLEALARLCLEIASNRREHILTMTEAEKVWTPAAKQLVRVKRFVERETEKYIQDRKVG